MSADNWAVCPRCKRVRADALATETRLLAEAYGKIPVEEFDQKRKALAEHEREHEHPMTTFREFYEFYGVETGTLHISYGGRCTVCELEFSHESEHELDWTS